MAARHIDNLDAIRAVSVILVMAFHARFLSFGWIGVWVFFALSGFLITRSLIGLKSESFSRGLGIFYARRSLRIFPVYFLYVTVFVLAFAIAGEGLPAEDVVFLYTYTTNLAPLFGEEVTGRAFAHLWSLGVEEQYYLLVAPFMLLFALRAGAMFFAAMVVVVPLLRWWAFQSFSAEDASHAATVVKAVTIFQMDSFMVGGLLAFGEARIRAAKRGVFLAVAALIVAASVAMLVWNYRVLAEAGLITPFSPALAFSHIPEWRLSPTSLGMGIEPRENSAYVWLYTLLALNSGLLIAAVIRFGQGFSLGIANRIGRVSYGMYIYHSVMVAGFDAALRMTGIEKYSALGLLGFLALVVMAWGVAEASFAWIERPFLRLKDRVGKDRAAVARPALSAAE
ncbi:acyltransferase [Mesorhizobium sp. KR9-304]|uniref:acyltransferase family protein n=1 Tax=Mesorhizobium sp. KR9-304 TaxID=3156614 RepID=UPI0032B5170C